jgi:hypothetical protein
MVCVCARAQCKGAIEEAELFNPITGEHRARKRRGADGCPVREEADETLADAGDSHGLSSTADGANCRTDADAFGAVEHRARYKMSSKYRCL